MTEIIFSLVFCICIAMLWNEIYNCRLNMRVYQAKKNIGNKEGLTKDWNYSNEIPAVYDGS